VLEYINISDNQDNKTALLQKEQYYLNLINPSLNVCKMVDSPLGVKRDMMFSINLSKARRGYKYNRLDKVINRISKITTPETILKISSRRTGIKVKIFDNSNNLIREFPTIRSAAKYLSVSNRTISKILNTGISYDNLIYKFEVPKEYPIVVINKENNTVKEYYSIRATAKSLGVSS
jgi:hypothetical protein